MDPDYLLRDELEYELASRGIEIQGSLQTLRLVLKELLLLSSERIRAPRLILKNSSSTELEFCSSKLSCISNYVSEIVGRPDNRIFKQLVSRLYHVYNRLDLLDGSISGDELTIKSELTQRCRSLLLRLEELDDLEEYELTSDSKKKLLEMLGDIGESIIRKLDAQGLLQSSCLGERAVEEPHHAAAPLMKLPQSPRGNLDSTEVSARKLVPIRLWGIKYCGRSNVSVNAFIERVEELKVARNATDVDLWVYAIDFFEDDALIWFRANKEYMRNWKELTVQLKQAFQQPFYQEQLLSEINSRTQGCDESVFIFISKMQNMCNRLPMKLSEHEKIRIIRKNLQPYYQIAMCRDEVNSIAELMDILRLVEKTKVSCDNFREPEVDTLEPDRGCISKRLPVTHEVSEIKEICTVDTVEQAVMTRCWNCRGYGHAFKECSLPKQHFFCQNCGCFGLTIKNCKCHGNAKGRKLSSCPEIVPQVQQNKEWQVWLDLEKRFFSQTDGELCPVTIKKRNDNRSYVVLSILGYQCVGLLDTGANRTVVNVGFAEKLRTLGLTSSTIKTTTISTADGVSHDITDIMDMPVSFDGQFHIISVLIMPGLSQQLILGKDFFDTFGIELQFKSDTMVSHTEINEMTLNDPAVVARDSLSREQEEKLSQIINEMKQSIGEGLGRTKILQHYIDTGDNKPQHQKQYNFSPIIRAAIEKELDEMLSKDVVEPSYSSWCSPVLIVKKPNGDNRLCLDSRQLNKVTKRDTYPLPRVSSIIDNLRNARFLSTIDLKSAFWQIELESSCKEKTAFAVPGRGLYQFKVMPFGLVNASQTQQRLMDILFRCNEDKIWAYLDDIVICSSDFEEHLQLLKKVMSVLKAAYLTVNVDKCKFARDSLKFLGYIVDKDGLRTDPEKVDAILNFPRPTSYTELKRFIGLASWYRRFVENFSVVAAPLHDLTKGKKHKKFLWTDDAERAFVKLKTLLTSTPVVTCPDYTKPFIIQCDASSNGVGAVLCQNIDGVDRPIAYLSRKLSDRESKYSTSERELLSIVHAIEKFRPYVDGTHFTVVTDHSALLWLHKTKDPHGRLARWAMKLQQFSFDIVHRPGKCHIVPDALSRCNNTNIELDTIEILDHHKDNWYRQKVEKLTSDNTDSDWAVHNGLLLKRQPLKQFPNKENQWKLFVPEALRSEVLRECHDDVTSGHLGIRKTYFKTKLKYYWQNMLQDIKQYVNNCDTCARYKVSQQMPLGEMGRHREASRPWQIIALDLMGPFPKSKKCNTMLLVITCCFSKFTLLFPLRTGKADKICEITANQFLLYGAPEKIICDNGKQFESHLFKELAQRFNTEIWYTPHYHPQSNPTERVNRVIGTMISSYTTSKKHNEWDLHLHEIGHAIRSAVHEATGYTPAYLFFGRETMVPNFNLVCDSHGASELQDIHINVANVVRNIEQRNTVFRQVQDRLRDAHNSSAKYYDAKRRASNFQVGDTVWKRNKLLSKASSKFTAKLAPKFDKAIIADKISRDVFRLHNVFGKNIGVWHSKDLKPYRA